MALTVAYHGGGCCGIYHLFGFTWEEERSPDLIRRALETIPHERLVEVVLNEWQMDNLPICLRMLDSLGFVLVGSFKNGNTSRKICVFHRAGNRYSLDYVQEAFPDWRGKVISADLDEDLVDLSVPEREGELLFNPLTHEVPVPNIELVRAIVSVTYHNVYPRNGRGPGWDTYNDARQRGGRYVRQVDKKTIYSDGSVEWEENFRPL